MEELTLDKRIRLSAMMFLQYMMFAVWFVPLALYLAEKGRGDWTIPYWQTAIIMSSMPLGCLVSPIVCMIADRHFASQKVLAVLNLACAILFFLAARATTPMQLFVALLLAMFCYMPTWSLTSAIAMSHSPSEKFPQIRSFGSIGWVAALVFSFIADKFFGGMKIDGTAIPFYCGAGTAVLAALVNFTLPNTPPPAKGQKASLIDVLGLPAIKLMKERNFALYIVLSMLIMVPFVMYFSYGSEFFGDQGFDQVTQTMNYGQLVEMFLMFLMPLALARFGIKWTMTMGLVALVLRYVMFWFGGVYEIRLLYYGAILIHGLIFGFFLAGGQVYVDKKAPPHMRAQAQGLIFLLSFGLGWLAGNFFNAKLIDVYSTVQPNGAKVYNWNPIWVTTTIISLVLLVAFVLLFRDDVSKAKVAALAEEATVPSQDSAPEVM